MPTATRKLAPWLCVIASLAWIATFLLFVFARPTNLAADILLNAAALLASLTSLAGLVASLTDIEGGGRRIWLVHSICNLAIAAIFFAATRIFGNT
jgi:hypothetical protein